MRIYVKMSDKLGEKVAKYADDFGMSKSSFITYAVAQHINNLDKQDDVYNSIADILSDAVSKNGYPDERSFHDENN